jgi:hypothetical protein
MKLLIPFSRLSIVVALERDPQGTPRHGLTLRAAMVLIAASAPLLWWSGELLRDHLSRQFSVAYAVGDLLTGPPDLERLAAEVERSVPQGWWAPQKRSVTFFHLSNSLIIRDTQSGHEQIKSWLKQQQPRPQDRNG